MKGNQQCSQAPPSAYWPGGQSLHPSWRNVGTPAGQGSHCVEASLAKRPGGQGSQRSADEDDEAAGAAGAVPAGHVTHCKSGAFVAFGTRLAAEQAQQEAAVTGPMGLRRSSRGWVPGGQEKVLQDALRNAKVDPSPVLLRSFGSNQQLPDESSRKEEQFEASQLRAQSRKPETAVANTAPRSDQAPLASWRYPEFTGRQDPARQASFVSLHGQLGQLLKVQNREMSEGKPSAFELARSSQSVMPEPEKALFMAFACGMDVKFHVDNGCLKLLALRNMFFMSVTADTSQVLRGWSKDEATKNMPLMLVTPDTSQAPMGWLKELAR